MTDIRVELGLSKFDVRACGLLRHQGDLLVSTEVDGTQTLSGGAIKIGETSEEAVIREFKEETNLDTAKILGTFESFHYTTPKKPKVHQINFKVTTKPGDIALTEHDALKWITVDEISDLKTDAVMQNCLEKAFDS